MTVVTNPARSISDEVLDNIDIELGAGNFDHDPDADDPLDDQLDDLPDDPLDDHLVASLSGSVEDLAARLYDNERRSDIEFVVGVNGDTWRYPGHRQVLAATSPVFAALLSAKTDTIVVDYVDRRGFEQLLRYHYCEPTQLASCGTARAALDAAYKFLCAPLAERCARRLDEMLDAGVALDVLLDLRYMCAQLPGAASAPPLTAITNDTAARALAQCSRWADSLAHNTLLVLDERADEALADERLAELPYEDLALVVRRDTLRVSSELLLVEALARWATAACKRSRRELTPLNKRAALGALAYCPRYLLLAGEELERALALELLQPVERALVRARARGASAPVPVGAEQEALLRRWARPRPTEPAALPVHLSARSEPAPEEPERTTLCGRRRRPRRPDFSPVDKNDRGCCACFGEGLLRALICLFD